MTAGSLAVVSDTNFLCLQLTYSLTWRFKIDFKRYFGLKFYLRSSLRHRYSACSTRCSYNESFSRSPVNCNTYRSGSSFSDSHRSSLCPSRGSSSSSPYYDSHRMSPCSVRSSSNRGCDCRYSSYYSKQSASSTNWAEGWIGHPLDPVGCIFDTLAEASLILDDNMPYTPSFFGENPR